MGARIDALEPRGEKIVQQRQVVVYWTAQLEYGSTSRSVLLIVVITKPARTRNSFFFFCVARFLCRHLDHVFQKNLLDAYRRPGPRLPNRQGAIVPISPPAIRELSFASNRRRLHRRPRPRCNGCYRRLFLKYGKPPDPDSPSPGQGNE